MVEIKIVLVEPQHPGNIGAAARAMKTMGQDRLVLVAPQRFPDPQAQWRAAGGEDVLDQAQVVGTLDEAIGDCHWVVGTSARLRRIPWPLLTPKALGDEILKRKQQTVAILFGREDSGLTNDELQRCQTHIEIPGNPEYPVLNVAMAVQVICYELFQATHEVEPAAWDRPPATNHQFEGLLGHLETTLTNIGFVDPQQPGQTLTRLRRLFGRVEMDTTEVAMLRGILKAMDSAQGNSGPK